MSIEMFDASLTQQLSFFSLDIWFSHIKLFYHYFIQRTCFALNWPKLTWCKDRWNVYIIYAVQLICTNIFIFFICKMFIGINVLLIYLTNLFYRYNKKRAYKSRNTRTNSFFNSIRVASVEHFTYIFWLTYRNLYFGRSTLSLNI